MASSSAWLFIGIFVILPLVVAAAILAAVDSAVWMILGLVLVLTFATTGFILGASLLVADE